MMTKLSVAVLLPFTYVIILIMFKLSISLGVIEIKLRESLTLRDSFIEEHECPPNQTLESWSNFNN